MKSTTVKRGRPKKVKELDDVTKEALKGAQDAEKSSEKNLAAQPLPGESIAFLNKRFHSKDGTVCTVMYGGCKKKPIDIHFKT